MTNLRPIKIQSFVSCWGSCYLFLSLLQEYNDVVSFLLISSDRPEQITNMCMNRNLWFLLKLMSLQPTGSGSITDLIGSTFSCGIHQTGPFLSYGSPNGLLGLGMDKISIPSTLARGGHTADSFSMCFGPDGIGRFTFGDKGSPNMSQTPFVDEYE